MIFSPADFVFSRPTILQSYKYGFSLGAFAKIRYICHR
nr:MAG TPA: hypothetical protein [Caudoviricetes sp.]